MAASQALSCGAFLLITSKLLQRQLFCAGGANQKACAQHSGSLEAASLAFPCGAFLLITSKLLTRQVFCADGADKKACARQSGCPGVCSNVFVSSMQCRFLCFGRADAARTNLVEAVHDIACMPSSPQQLHSSCIVWY